MRSRSSGRSPDSPRRCCCPRRSARLGVRPGWRASSALFLVAPETILTESWFFYTQLQMLADRALIAVRARPIRRRSPDDGDGVLFAGSLGALVLLRSSIHIVLMVLVLVVVWRQLSLSTSPDRGHRRGPAVRRRRVVGQEVARVRQLDQQLVAGHEPLVRRACGSVAAGLSPTRGRRHGQRVGVPGRVPSAVGVHRRVPAPDALRRPLQPIACTSRRVNRTSTQRSTPTSRRSTSTTRSSCCATAARPRSPAPSSRRTPCGRSPVTTRSSSGPTVVPIAGYADWFDRLVLLRPVATGWNNPARFTASSGRVPVGRSARIGELHDPGAGRVRGLRRRRRLAPPPGDRVLRTRVHRRRRSCSSWSVVIGNTLDYRENNRFRVEAGRCMLVLAAVGLELALRRVTNRRRGDGGPTAVHPSASPVAAIPVSPSHHHGDGERGPVVDLDQVHEAERRRARPRQRAPIQRATAMRARRRAVVRTTEDPRACRRPLTRDARGRPPTGAAASGRGWWLGVAVDRRSARCSRTCPGTCTSCSTPTRRAIAHGRDGVRARRHAVPGRHRPQAADPGVRVRGLVPGDRHAGPASAARRRRAVPGRLGARARVRCASGRRRNAGWWAAGLLIAGATALQPTDAQAANFAHLALLPGCGAIVAARIGSRRARRWRASSSASPR